MRVTRQLFDIPVEDMTNQQLNAYLSHTDDAVFDLNVELKFLRERQRVLLEEIQRRKGKV
jgi:hypothetical protein